MAARHGRALVALVVGLTGLDLGGLGCTSPKGTGSGTSTGGQSGSSAATSSSGGTSGGTSGSLDGGGTSGSSSGSGGSLDGGCHHLGQVAELGACVLSVDCQCPLMCVPDPQGNLLCQMVCGDDADCGAGATCDAGRCQAGPVCNPLGGAKEFQPCAAVSDCPCPLGCFADFQLGEVCEKPCVAESDCLGDAGEFCESDSGSCQLTPSSACDPGLTGRGDFQPCRQASDCGCPLECFYDGWRGMVCELPCGTDSDCAGAGGRCDTDAGSCQPFCSLTGAPAFAPCSTTVQCTCPLACVFNEAYGGFCGLCDGGACVAPGGACVDAGPIAAASQTRLPLVFLSHVLPTCTSNQDCDCPNECQPLSADYGFVFVCQPPLPACSKVADCADPSTTCLFGVCVSNLCSEGEGLDSPCDLRDALENAPDAGVGACVPDPRIGDWLVCIPGGDGGVGCSLTPDRAHPETLCPAGSTCVAKDAGTDCAAACGFGQGCDSGSNCALLDPEESTGYGFFQACLPGEQTCTFDLPVYVPDGGPFDASSVGAEYAPCYGNDCLCPLSCNPDPVLAGLSFHADSFCERPCQTNADCPSALTTCAAGLCQFDADSCSLEGDGGGDAGGLGGVCDAGDGPGTCIYFAPFVEQWQSPGGVDQILPAAVCRFNGPALEACDPEATRGSSALCGAGMDCLPLADGGFGCQALCDPQAADGGCGPGFACVRVTFNAEGINEGTCLALVDGGCALGLPADELAACQADSDCACGLGCFKDWQGRGLRCEHPCTAAADCPPDDVCYGEAGKRSCQLNLCNVAAIPGATDVCNADLTSGGTCVVETVAALPPDAFPSAPPEAPSLVDVCLQAGTATGACDPSADRSRPASLCVPGAVCDDSGPTPMCTWLCTVGPGGTPCPAGQFCVASATYLTQMSDYYLEEDVAIQGDCLPALGVDGGT